MATSLIVKSLSNDPFVNLSLGALLQRNVGYRRALLLCRSHHGVFVGRNQNIWRECIPSALRADGVPLLRRDTGGGACYVDRGNLLFSVLSPRPPEYSFLEAALARVMPFHLRPRLIGRNDLCLPDGRKVSGSATSIHQGIWRHHGTLLEAANLDAMHRYLRPNPLKIEAHGVPSQRARVANLKEVHPSLAKGALEEALMAEFRHQHPDCQRILWSPEEGGRTLQGVPVALSLREPTKDYLQFESFQFESIYHHFTSRSWIHNQDPPCTFFLQRRFDFGQFDIHLHCDRQCLLSVKLFSDTLHLELVDWLETALSQHSDTFDDFEGEQLFQEKLERRMPHNLSHQGRQLIQWLVDSSHALGLCALPYQHH